MNNQRLVFGATALAIVAAFIVGGMVYRKEQSAQRAVVAQQNLTAFVRPHSQVLGAADAMVVISEFTDPACETCAQFSPMLKQLVDAHPGRVKLVVRYAPLHPGSEEVVRLLHASIQQGKFWETLETMYGSQQRWTVEHHAKPELLLPLLAAAGLDLERLTRDANEPATVQAVTQDIADLRAVGVKATPEFFVNGKPLPTWGYAQLVDLVNAELAASAPR